MKKSRIEEQSDALSIGELRIRRIFQKIHSPQSLPARFLQVALLFIFENSKAEQGGISAKRYADDASTMIFSKMEATLRDTADFTNDCVASLKPYHRRYALSLLLVLGKVCQYRNCKKRAGRLTGSSKMANFLVFAPQCSLLLYFVARNIEIISFEGPRVGIKVNSAN